MATTAVSASEPPERVNPFGRIVGVIFSPKETFESIVRKPTWLVPTILLCVVELCLVGIYGHRAGWRGLVQKQLSNNSQFQELPAADQESRIEVATRIASKVVYAEMIIFPFLAVLFFAGILWVIFNLLVGGKFNFVTSMGIVSHALVPTIIASLLGIVILFVKDPSTVDLQHLVASNAGAFLSNDASKALTAFLRFVDIFLFWEMILLAIGFHAAAPKKVSFAAAFAWIFALWLVAALATTGLVAAFT